MEGKRMARGGRGQISSEEFGGLFSGGRPVKISTMVQKLGVCRATVTRQMRKHHTHTSINRNAAFCILPGMCRFDELGFYRLRGMVFFRDGNQLEAIVRFVTDSEAGRALGEINAAIGSRAAVQVLGLVRAGRLQRESWGGQYVYWAADADTAERQRARRRALADQHAASGQESLEQLLARESRENLQLLVNVLLTCLRHPQFSAKSVALSLVRRGWRTCTEQVRELFERFDIKRKKGGS